MAFMQDGLLHPALVHVPIGLALVTPFVALMVLVAWRRGSWPASSWAVVVMLQAVMFGFSVAATRTGEAEEERVERIVPEKALEEHEEAGERFMWVAGVEFALGAVAWGLRASPVSVPVAIASTLVAVGGAAFAFRTGALGGELVYRHGAAEAWRSPEVSSTPVSGDESYD